jgi:hypothetical protein
MAAVPESPVPTDPAKETIGSLQLIREMLDNARTVDEAVSLLDNYNITWMGGPPLHYLIADALGGAALIEFSAGEKVVLRNQERWQHATNFLRSAAGATTAGMCWRYDRIEQRLMETQGRLSVQEAMDLLSDVAQPSTQWSVVYGMTAGTVTVAMGRDYDQLHAFPLNTAANE